MNEDKQIEEILRTPDYPVASVTYNVTSPQGFGLLLTVRRSDEAELFDLMTDIEKFLTEHKYTPEVKKSFGKALQNVVEGEKCPECGSALVKFNTKDGKQAVKCSTSKWDFNTKTASGCKYFKYVDEPVTATPTQKTVLESLGKWKEGMTYQEAASILVSIK